MLWRAGLSAAVAVALPLSASAQGPWTKSDWKRWSAKDCKRILEDSPWARRWDHPYRYAGEDPASEPGLAGPVFGAEGFRVFYIVRFQSALPVRQAAVRADQIESRYDKMNQEQRKAFDASWEPYLKRSYDDEVALHVSYGTAIQYRGGLRSAAYISNLVWGWEAYPQDSPPEGTALVTSTGLRVRPSKIVHLNGKKAFVLFFPRWVNGESVFSENVQSVRIEFPHPGLKLYSQPGTMYLSGAIQQGMQAAVVSAEFEIEKMKSNGEVLF